MDLNKRRTYRKKKGGSISESDFINLFPDFYEWLIFLSKISENTDYDWYIKDHPPYEKLKAIRSFNRTYELSKNLFKNNKGELDG